MTKAGVLNFFGVARAFSLALALCGLTLALGSVAINLLMPAPTLPMLNTMVMLAMMGALGIGALVIGAVLALVCSLTRFFVARMTFSPVLPA